MSKKFLRTLIAVLLVCAMLPIPTAFAESATVTGSDVNVRSGPGTNYPVVDCLPKGASVEVTDRSNSSWYAIRYNGNSGYMSSRYLKISEETTTPPPANNAGGVPGHINAMYVRFRSGPSSGSAILGEYNKGKSLTITGSSNGWTACIIDGKSGYVFSQYVTRDGEADPVVTNPPAQDPDPGDNGGVVVVIIDDDTSPAPAPTAAPAPAPTADPEPTNAPVIVVLPPDATETPDPTPTPVANPEPTQTPTPTQAPIVVLDPPGTTPTPEPSADPVPVQTPTPTAEPLPSVVPVNGKPGTITGDYVRFRSGPGTNYGILGTYNKGKELTITGVSGAWTACVIDGAAGYVYSQYVKEKEEAPVTDPEPAESPEPTESPAPSEAPVEPVENGAGGEPGYITGNNVRFRSGPSMSSEILGELFYGNVVTITGVSGEWTAVIYDGKAGYVYSQYVAKGQYDTDEPDDPEEPTEPEKPGESPKPSDPGISSSALAKGKEIAKYAKQFVGYPYVWGGMDPSTGFDCSGLVYYVYKQFGYTLNRVAADQARNGVHVDPDKLQPGDVLCFYSSGSYIGHAGIYIGNNQFVHAANSRSGVIISDLTGYYATRGFEARRIVN